MPLTTEQIQIIKMALPSVIENEPMAKHTNFRIGGPARLYFVAQSSDDLMKAVHTASEEGIPWYLFGGGSNLLVSDKGYDGLMIQAADRHLSFEGTKVSCGVGAITALVARKTAEAGLIGFEWAVSIPGTIGGAIFGNAGCYGGEIKDVVTSVNAYRLSDGERVAYTKEECLFGYRDSLFKHEQHVILGCTMELKEGDAQTALAKLNEINAKRKDNQPLGESSAGCMFKNFEFKDEKDIEKLKQEVDVPQEMIDAKRIPAGWLVERCGLKGHKLGGVEVSQRHANFLINDGTGTADHVAQLVSLCQMKVRDNFGVPLMTEVQFIGFG
jgi:UDP-N-acetylmuramate dehydrogenase